MKDTLTVTFKRCKAGEKRPDEPTFIIYKRSSSDGELRPFIASGAALDIPFDCNDLWYAELSQFKEKPMTAKEFANKYEGYPSFELMNMYAEYRLNFGK